MFGGGGGGCQMIFFQTFILFVSCLLVINSMFQCLLYSMLFADFSNLNSLFILN